MTTRSDVAGAAHEHQRQVGCLFRSSPSTPVRHCEHAAISSVRHRLFHRRDLGRKSDVGSRKPSPGKAKSVDFATLAGGTEQSHRKNYFGVIPG